MAKDLEYEGNNFEEEKDNGLSLVELLQHYMRNWYWFVFSAVICLGLGTYYLLTTPKIRTVTAELLVKETSGKRSASDFGDFGSFDMFQQKSNINNELATLSSPDLMSDVVKMLNLEMNYTVKGTFHDKVLYGQDLPVNVYVNPDSLLPEDPKIIQFELKCGADSAVTLTGFRFNGEKIGKDDVSGKLTQTLATPIGNVVVTPTANYVADENKDIDVSWITQDSATKKYNNELSVSQNDEKSSIINIAVSDVSPARAKDIITTLISVYNKKWVDDKNQIAQSTSNFISERLGVIESELGNVDSEISSYKSENLLPDVNAASDMYMKQANEANSEILALTNQLEMARMVRAYLLDPDKKYQLVPENTGFEGQSMSTQINNYNQKVLDRNTIVANSSPSNPIVKDMDQSLTELRGAIVSSIDNHIEALRGKIRTKERQQGQAISHISSNPEQAKYLLTVERQQKVKESLYLFLLQKREENELSQAFTAYNTRIIAQPRVSEKVTPVSRNILLLALVIGLLIPAAIIYMRVILNSKVRGKKDLENMPMPFVGEIPDTTPKKFSLLPRKVKIDASPDIVVKEGCRNIINEAFRVVRANLEFMMGKDNKVVALTSFNPGSGKTFISFNLAIALALKKKKVIAVDLDLRKGSLSKYVGSPRYGVTDYIIGRKDNLDSLIVNDACNTPLSVLPMGTMPPNPTELLYSDKFKEMISYLRREYDIVILDCPPAELMADAQIINAEADFTLFIIRAGLFERDMLDELKEFYRSKRLKNLSIVLNGTESTGGSYGTKFGYRYGYGNYFSEQ